MNSLLTQTIERPAPTEKQPAILLPVVEPDEARRLLPLALALAKGQGGRVVVLAITVVAEGQPLSDGMLETRRVRAVFESIPAAGALRRGEIQVAVHVARSHGEAIRSAVDEQGATLVLLGWQADLASPERLFGPPLDDLLCDPPCPVAVARLADAPPWQGILLPVRGGPHTALASQTAQALAAAFDTTISVLYASDPRLPDDAAARETLEPLRALPRVAQWLERETPAEQAILDEAFRHQAIVLGVTGRRDDPEAPVGPLVNHILRHATGSVILVSHPLAQAEAQAQRRWQRQRDWSGVVDRWFAENTFSSAEFERLHRLVALKQEQALTISLGLPALNEEATIGEIIALTQQRLVEEVPLLDEIVLIDSGSQDRTREIAASHGLPVVVHPEILPQYGSFVGKGEALWKSLYTLQGDILAWVDTDIRNFHPRFVYGIVGPLLHEPRLQYCKGFYRRPLQHGAWLADEGGGRVTELTARPLLNLFYPELSGLVQPLSGEYAGRRSALEQVPFFTGYGIEVGLLIDLLQDFGLGALAQVDLRQRVHRNQALQSLSKMSFAIIQAIIQRLEARQRVHLLEAVNQSMKLIRYGADDGFHLEVREIRDHERPPMATIPEYQQRHRAAQPLPSPARPVEATVPLPV